MAYSRKNVFARLIWQLVTYDVGKLGLGDEVLSLSADKLLLEDDNLGALGLLQLQLLDLVGNLGLVVTTGLDALLGVADSLENATAVINGVGVGVLLLTNLAQDDTNLVRDITDGFIASVLTPVGQLSSNGDALAASSLVGIDQVVLRLDELEELAGELRLRLAAERVERKRAALTAGAATGPLVGASGADGKGTIPVRRTCVSNGFRM